DHRRDAAGHEADLEGGGQPDDDHRQQVAAVAVGAQDVVRVRHLPRLVGADLQRVAALADRGRDRLGQRRGREQDDQDPDPQLELPARAPDAPEHGYAPTLMRASMNGSIRSMTRLAVSTSTIENATMPWIVL